jgi:hypothetical protein
MQAPVLHALLWPWGFWRLLGQHPCRRRALTARVLAPCRVGWRAPLRLSGRVLVRRFAGDSRPRRDPGGGCVDPHAVLGRRRCLRAAVRLLVRRGVDGPLATARGAVHDPLGGARPRQGAGGDPARVARRRHAARGSGVRQDRQQRMPPGVGPGWAQRAGQAVQGGQGGGLLSEAPAEPLVLPLGPDAVGAPAHLPWASLAFPGLVRWREDGRGRGNRRQQTRKRCACPSGRCQKLFRSVLSGRVCSHPVIIHSSR